MAITLGELLIQEGLATPAQIDSALKAQVIFGGRLGTNLVELGVIDLDALTRVLSKHFGVPAALQKHFDQIQPQAVALLPKKVAEKHMAVPLGITQKSPKTLAVAFADPRRMESVDETAFVAGCRIYPVVAPELRIYYYLEKLYGTERKTRFLRIIESGNGAAQQPPGQPATERRRYLDPNDTGSTASSPPPRPPPQQLTSEPRSAPYTATGAGSHAASTPADKLAPDIEVPAGLFDAAPAYLGEEIDATVQPLVVPPPKVAPPPVERPSAEGRPAITAAVATSSILEATSRDQIGDAIVDFLRSTFGYGLVLIVRDELALGWKGFAPGVEPDVLETLSIPMRSPSVLKLAYERKALFRGAAPADGNALNNRMWKLLRSPVPQEVICAPVVLKERVVLLVYAHAADAGVLPSNALVDTSVVCTSAAAGFARLIQSAKIKVAAS